MREFKVAETAKFTIYMRAPGRGYLCDICGCKIGKEDDYVTDGSLHACLDCMYGDLEDEDVI